MARYHSVQVTQPIRNRLNLRLSHARIRVAKNQVFALFGDYTDSHHKIRLKGIDAPESKHCDFIIPNVLRNGALYFQLVHLLG
jgi:endonuclease YncB( thermonuclease family)